MGDLADLQLFDRTFLVSKQKQMHTTCACGADVTVHVKKPSWFQNTIAKVVCQSCDSLFLAKCSVDKEKNQTIKINFEVLRVSEKLEKRLLDKPTKKKKRVSNEPA